MLKLIKKLSVKKGLAPGTPIHVGTSNIAEYQINIITYNKNNIKIHSDVNVDNFQSHISKDSFTWINIDNINQVNIIEKLVNKYNIHKLHIEDIVNATLKPTIDIQENYIFVIIKVLQYNKENDCIDLEQFSIIFTKKEIITFQEKSSDLFDKIKEHLLNQNNMIRQRGTDYIAYSLIDIVVDNYFSELVKLAERIEILENETMKFKNKDLIYKIHSTRKDITIIQKLLLPVIDILFKFEKSDSNLIDKRTKKYIHDVYEHILTAINIIEIYQELTSSIYDVYNSIVNNKNNEVMKVLAIIATIFIPLTFIVGIYGMNFKNMPELEWSFGYPLIMLITLCIAIVMLIYFKIKKWF